MTGGFGPLASSAPDGSRWKGHARVLGPSYTHLPTLTIGLLGVQIFWSVEMAYASPYLLSLGLSSSHVALVFLAGPLSGLVVQPLIGALADSSTSRWGRRRPYMLGGCLVWRVAATVTTWGSPANDRLTVALAVLSIFIIDFAVNAVQATDRALLVDTLPPSAQAAGNACAALMLGTGSVVGFFVATLPLPTLLPFLHAASSLEALAPLVSLLLIGCHLITALFVRERVLLGGSAKNNPSLLATMRDIWSNARTLPGVILRICMIQFFAWLGWFPVLFYTTMYVSDIYHRANPEPASSPATDATALLARGSASALPASPQHGPAPLHVLLPRLVAILRPAPSVHPRLFPRADDVSAVDADLPTRLGARAQLISALLALLTNAVLPFLIPKPSAPNNDDLDGGGRGRRRGLRNSRLMGVSGGIAAGRGNGGDGADAWGMTDDAGGRWAWLRVPDALSVPLPTLWAASHAVFAGCMLGTFFTHSVAGATVLIALTGFSWGVTQWAPFSLLGEAILTAPAPGASGGGSMSIRLADARTPREAEEAVFLVSRGADDSDSDGEDGVRDRPGDRDADSDSESEMSFVKAGDEDEDDDENTPRGPRETKRRHEEEEDGMGWEDAGAEGSAGGLGRGLLNNPHAQVSVVDVLTPRPDYGFSTPLDGVPPPPDGDADTDEYGRRESGGLSAKAGVILGIHNISIVIPQFLISGLTSIILAMSDGPAPTPATPTGGAGAPAAPVVTGRNSVVYVFRIGGIWAAVAFVLAWRLARELRRR
ncbi:MFS general substrate transporter [Mycena rebaudengoi]|nr:MFS general substrate transporter [Mycena rebaudengoi]